MTEEQVRAAVIAAIERGEARSARVGFPAGSRTLDRAPSGRTHRSRIDASSTCPAAFSVPTTCWTSPRISPKLTIAGPAPVFTETVGAGSGFRCMLSENSLLSISIPSSVAPLIGTLLRRPWSHSTLSISGGAPCGTWGLANPSSHFWSSRAASPVPRARPDQESGSPAFGAGQLCRQ